MMRLFREGQIGSLWIPNRLVRSATAERMSAPDGLVTEPLIAMYRELAAGGVGLIIAGHSYVRADGRTSKSMSALDRDETVAGWRRLTDAVHAEGGRIAAQINHGGRQCDVRVVGVARAPSAVPFKGATPEPLTDAEIWELVGAYAAAARRAVDAGFDAVQIHGAHGYLISSFHSPYTNHRDDAWGGSLANRGHFGREVTRAIREEVGPTYPLLLKLNASDGVAGGVTREDAVQLARDLEAAGVDAIEVSGGIADSDLPWAIRPVTPETEAYFAGDARAIRAAVTIPVILVGGIRSFEVAEAQLESGAADFVSLCRPLIREPGLPQRWAAGQREPATCISCDRCGQHPGGGVRCEVDASR
jgi:2,4-dienoyl-CoA reductase-like NADH-dependent reductase (Old Yellow Enzyme family)